jgi:hypothetical protein
MNTKKIKAIAIAILTAISIIAAEAARIIDVTPF